jgi:drug/metabolite transporter (DMT)-like permease
MLNIQGFHPDLPPAIRTRVMIVLAFAVLAISSSAVLVRGMEMGAIAIAAWRTLGSAILLSPGIYLGRSEIGRSQMGGILLAGAALALHFPLWFASLDYTPILRSTVLVALVPIWTGLLEWLFDAERPSTRFWVGVGLAIPGVAILSGADGWASGTLFGDALALAGGMAWAVYLLVGRRVRQTVQITTYMGLVCGVAALLLFPIAWFTGPLTGFGTQTWMLLAAAILAPQLVGHQGSSYALRYLPASIVSAVLLLEPVGATILGALVYDEIPSAISILGGMMVVGGVVSATLSRPTGREDPGSGRKADKDERSQTQ